MTIEEFENLEIPKSAYYDITLKSHGQEIKKKFQVRFKGINALFCVRPGIYGKTDFTINHKKIKTISLSEQTSF